MIAATESKFMHMCADAAIIADVIKAQGIEKTLEDIQLIRSIIPTDAMPNKDTALEAWESYMSAVRGLIKWVRKEEGK